MFQLLAIAFFIIWIVLAIFLWAGVKDWQRYDFEECVGRIVKSFFGSCFFTTFAGLVIAIGSIAIGVEVRW